MEPKNPDYQAAIRQLFDQAAFVVDLGISLADIGPGWCETTLSLLPRHMQQDRVVHAGVQATMADHTAGAAAGSLIAADEIILTAEFKINLLRPAQGKTLRCRAQVLKPGRLLTVVESEVFAQTQNQEILVSKATVTLTTIKKTS